MNKKVTARFRVTRHTEAVLYEEVSPEVYEKLKKGGAWPGDLIPDFDEDILIALDGGDDNVDAWFEEH